jgi:uncharacterized protein (TIGR03546 family)
MDHALRARNEPLRLSTCRYAPPFPTVPGKDRRMLSPVVAILRRVLRGLLSSNAPDQLAAGFMLGMIIGLVPKGNLIALSLCVLLFSMRVNKCLALVAVVIFSAIGPVADSFSHKLGLALLSADGLQSAYALAYNLPLGPWLGFNNTVVAGSLGVGLYIAYPIYWTSCEMCTRMRPVAIEWISRHDAMASGRQAAQQSASRTAA